MFDGVKKVWTVLGTFGLVKPVGLLTIGVLAGGGAAAAGSQASQVLHWVLALLAVACGASVGVLTYVVRREGRGRKVTGRWLGLAIMFDDSPEPAAAVPEPEPWTYRAEIVPDAPAAVPVPSPAPVAVRPLAALTAARFVAGEVVEVVSSEKVDR